MTQSMMVVGLVFIFASIAVFLISTLHQYIHLQMTGTPISLFSFKICAIYWALGVVMALVGWFL